MGLEQHGGDAYQGIGQGIDIGGAGIAGKRGPDGARDTIAVHDGLGAVVAGADCNAEFVEQGAHVVGMGTAQQERDDARLVGCCSVDADAGNGREPLCGIFK